jgi:hypothetical protein
VSLSQLFLALILALGAASQPVELRLAEIYGPVGPRGLEYSAVTRRLEGSPVRIAGYMVRRDTPVAGSFLLSPVPVQLHDEEYGLADDLPAATVLVEGPGLTRRPVHYVPQRLAWTGVLKLGPREEPDGRISFVRLVVDELPPDFPAAP